MTTFYSSITGSPAVQNLDPALRNQLINEAIDRVNAQFSLLVLNDPTDEDRQAAREFVSAFLSAAAHNRQLRLNAEQQRDLTDEIVRRVLGLGFLDLLLPPGRTDISEIAIYSSGLVQIMRKGQVRFEDAPHHPEPGEIWRVLNRILGPQSKTLNEANPSLNARLPQTLHNPGGGRIKAVHPCIAPPGKSPSINIRLFEQKPVLPAWLVERGALSAAMMDTLRISMAQGHRILICGETRTGKTTLLSALCNFLPAPWRIIKIEDPEEIWIDRPTVQTLEARPQTAGTEMRPYTLATGVDDAMRMSPDYLIVGEVRDGRAGAALFRALMTGHSGACTFHAATPQEAVNRLTNVIGTDLNTAAANVAQMITMALDLFVQIGIVQEQRRVVSISAVERELQGGSVRFTPIWKYDFEAPREHPRWERTGVLMSRSGDGKDCPLEPLTDPITATRSAT